MLLEIADLKVTIHKDKDWINLSNIASKCGKQLKNWKATKRSKKFVRAFAKYQGIDVTHLSDKELWKCDQLFFEIKGNKSYFPGIFQGAEFCSLKISLFFHLIIIQK